MTDVQALLVVVGLILLGGAIVAWSDLTDPDVLTDSTERRQMAVKRDTTGRWW